MELQNTVCLAVARNPGIRQFTMIKLSNLTGSLLQVNGILPCG